MTEKERRRRLATTEAVRLTTLSSTLLRMPPMSSRAMTEKERRRRLSCREEHFRALKTEPKCKIPTKVLVQCNTGPTISTIVNWSVKDFSIVIGGSLNNPMMTRSLPRSLAFSSQVSFPDSSLGEPGCSHIYCETTQNHNPKAVL